MAGKCKPYRCAIVQHVKRRLLRLTAGTAVFLCILAASLEGRTQTITDMSGTTVTIPDSISKVVAISPPGTYLLYAIDPYVIGGLNFPPWENEKRFTIKAYSQLPVIGGLVGQGRTLNREVLLQVKPDFILYWAWKDDATNHQFIESLAPFHFPLVSVRLDSIYDYPDALLFVANILNKKVRGDLLATYAKETLAIAKDITTRIPEAEKSTVYYAEGTDGLSTERSDSVHAELIPLAGGSNVHKGKEFDHYGMEKISMEQLLLYDPDVILVKEQSFFRQVYTDPRWQNLRAVRNKRVLLIPYIPFNWFDRPPSFMRLLGIKWLLSELHPNLCDFDMANETRKFYRLFLGVDLTDDEILEILHR